MQVDSEFAGLLLAFGFLVMGLVSMPIATWFFLGALVLGGVVALLLRFTPKSLFGAVMGTVMVLIGVVLWWAGRSPQRPHGVSPKAIHLEANNAGFTLHKPGFWLECWFDANVDHCRLTDEKGTPVFEDVFLPCVGQTPIPESELVLDAQRTGSPWIRSSDNRINVPTVFLEDHRVLLPRSLYAEARRQIFCSYGW